jgi:hypothetical protein
VGPRAGLDRCGKYLPPPGFDPRTVAIPTELPGPPERVVTPSDPHMDRTAQLTSRRCILNTYSKNIRAEYFKHAA